MQVFDNLYGKSILVGKDPEKSRLLVSVSINGSPKSTAIGDEGSVPNCVSRCKAKENVAHCRIDIADDGTMRLTNLKAQNVTYVNGVEIATKVINTGSLVELGVNRYRLDIPAVIDTASKIVAKVVPTQPKTYSIAHLETVWNQHREKMMAIRKRQHKNQLLTRIPMIFTLGSGVISTLAKTSEWGGNIMIITLSMTGIGLLLMIYGFIRSALEKTLEKTEAENEDFKHKYACPNPECGIPLGNVDFDILKRRKRCPNCGCLYGEKHS
ncbi:MAG: FHA domain-containing protein [Bacteroidales bacterium]|nr:FHA domain-containing protein [Bacteroidales bacterium]